MAMEDAVELAGALTGHPGDLPAALAAYERTAQPSVRKIQDSARPSLAWWEHFGDYHDAFKPWQFAYHFLTRSIGDARLARRAPEFVGSSHDGWIAAHGTEPLETPFTSTRWRTPGRLVDIVTDAEGTPVAVRGNTDLPLSADPVTGGWGALVKAPDTEAGLPGVFARITELHGPDGPELVAVHGGTPLTRTLVCEQARMREHVPALSIVPAPDPDLALTTVLSGRADLVGVAR
jgi:anthraniloyl-CoA monooxygenase